MKDDSGLYQLVILLPKKRAITAGSLGRFSFPAGHYVYTGSAKRGLNARIARHIRKRKKMHWHIDYLLSYGNINKVIRYENGNLSECELNRRVESLPSSKIIARGFGSSDCKCRSHLVYFGIIPRFLTKKDSRFSLEIARLSFQ